MKLSARNQLRGTITAVEHGKVMSSVKVALPDGQSLTAAITREAAEDLDLAPGMPIVAVIKATEVMLGRE
jgi:molybdate transport system regulatory protein